MPFQPDPDCKWLCPWTYCAALIAVLNLDWRSRDKGGTLVYSCLVCGDGREKVASNCKDHENTYTHQQNLKRYKRPTQVSSSSGAPLPPTSDPPSSSSFPTNVNEAIQEDGVRALLRSITAQPDDPHYPLDFPGLIWSETHPPSPGTLTGISWNLQDELVLDEDPWKKAASRIALATLNFLNGDVSDEDENERPDLSDSEPETNPGELHSFLPTNFYPSPCITDPNSEDETFTQQPPKKRPRNYTTDESTARQWYPWQDRIVCHLECPVTASTENKILCQTCTLDILMHLPRSVFSQKQLDLFLWLLQVNEVDYVPGLDTMKALNKSIQNLCGIETVGYEGILGHRYFVNNISQILAQVRSYSHPYSV